MRHEGIERRLVGRKESSVTAAGTASQTCLISATRVRHGVDTVEAGDDSSSLILYASRVMS